MKVLIIGAGGGLGQTLMKVYSDLNPVGWTKSDLDITDQVKVYEKIVALEPNLVFNAAALNNLNTAEEDRALAEAVNGYGPGYVAEACQKVGATLVHFSCSDVFDGSNPNGFDEDSQTNPINAYGKSKLLGELEAMQNCDNLYVIRTSWLFGRLTLDSADGAAGQLDVVAQILQNKNSTSPISVANDEHGTPTYLLDLAQASRALVEEEKEFGVYHIANTGTVSKFDLAEHVKTTANLPVVINSVVGITLSRLYKAPTHSALNNTKFLQLRPWSEALDEYLQQITN